MSWKAWEYEGYYYDGSIGIYINEETGQGATLKYMAQNMQHLRVKK